MNGFRQGHIQANGIDFHYLEIGTGPLVLCLHGFPDNAFTYLGSVDEVRRSMDAMVENVHPEWLVWQGDQGFLPVEEVKRQIETYGKHLLPRYK